MSKYTTRVVLDDGKLHRTERGAALTIYPEHLVSFYPAEGRGSRLLDESKKGNHGSIIGGTRGDGIAGKAIRLKPTDYIEIKSSSDYNMGTHGFSIGIFFKPLDLSDGMILQKENGDAGYEIQLRNKKIKSTIKGGLGKSDLESNTKLSLSDDFYFISLVRGTGGFAKLYINGNKEDEIPSEYDVDSPSNLIIGDPAGNGIKGVVDEVYVYQVGLQEKLIKNIYKKYVGP